ncbi:methyltransferase domain-containing protein [Streptomyces niveus]|uniref:class I SAM-dependent methyltransferase n=1 Tax=Streptomyces niveus TaxID=193462 RepID=UPI003F4D180A
MAVLVVEHVPGEGPYAIGPALDAAGLRTRLCRVWAGDVLPESLVGIEALVVMGGPMAAHSDDGIFSAGLLDHLAEPAAALREWARVVRPGGTLLLFHPSGRAERAARHGRPPSPDDPLAEPNLRPMLTAGGWRTEEYDDARAYFLTRAVRTG